jgi:hypothetical protein
MREEGDKLMEGVRARAVEGLRQRASTCTGSGEGVGVNCGSGEGADRYGSSLISEIKYLIGQQIKLSLKFYGNNRDNITIMKTPLLC